MTAAARTLADDGDALRFCSTCPFASACRAHGMDKTGLRDLHVIVDHVGPFAAGSEIFHAGEAFESIWAVRAGTVKTSVVDREGREHVLDFHLAGELIGLDAIAGEVYPCDAHALDSVMLCRFSFSRIAELATRLPGLQQHLFRLLSRDIGRAALLSGDFSADERMAAFLVGLSERFESRGFSPSRFQLTMSRTDIANYLRLAPETVSRVLRRFQQEGLLDVDRREVTIRRAAELSGIAAPVLRR